ncbi:polysaccharide export protein [Novosphingobium sp. 1949]|uniref:Polysaccharide export protein n=1 Tax=Novosphingobium organovorum TaxID=2930092 RepID=A0ABT0BEL8_9SPHN|nr:polysaccharide biosynthesis/export family protein [Novosphingobium organovorum]MCJ2183288.1 polysaccharide export protein [Novosphingobium organovorum]
MAFRILILAGALALGGCAATAQRSLPSVAAVEYHLAPGDKLKLAVFREETLSGEYTVNEDGAISLPMVGDFKVAGKSLDQAREELTRTLGASYVRDARISLDMVDYRPVFILGEVQKPGEYDYAQRMSVYALVAKAGGFTYRANEKVVYIRHGNEGEESAYALTSGAAILPGDTVRIGARYF